MCVDLSIIIPVYNAEKTLKACLQSCFKQDGLSKEIIVVNDGSTDETNKVLSKARKKFNIKTISISNSGPSHARNVGLDAASGRYVAFCDADDWLDQNSLSKIISYMDENEIDIAISGYRNIRSSKVKTHQFYRYMPMDVDRFMGAILLDSRVMGFVFNKIYRRAIVGDTRFHHEISVCEDADFNLQLVSKLHHMRIIGIPGARYNYDLRQLNSLTRSSNTYHALHFTMGTFFKYGDVRFSKDVRAGLYSAALKARSEGVTDIYAEDLTYAEDYWLNNHCPLVEKMKMLTRIAASSIRSK